MRVASTRVVRLGRQLALLASLAATVTSSLSAQVVPAAPTGLDITPDGGSALNVSTGVHSVEFTAHNGLITAGTWSFTCSKTGGGDLRCGCTLQCDYPCRWKSSDRGDFYRVYWWSRHYQAHCLTQRGGRIRQPECASGGPTRCGPPPPQRRQSRPFPVLNDWCRRKRLRPVWRSCCHPFPPRLRHYGTGAIPNLVLQLADRLASAHRYRGRAADHGHNHA